MGMEKADSEFNQMSDTMVSRFAMQGLLINEKRA